MRTENIGLNSQLGTGNRDNTGKKWYKYKHDYFSSKGIVKVRKTGASFQEVLEDAFKVQKEIDRVRGK